MSPAPQYSRKPVSLHRRPRNYKRKNRHIRLYKHRSLHIANYKTNKICKCYKSKSFDITKLQKHLQSSWQKQFVLVPNKECLQSDKKKTTTQAKTVINNSQKSKSKGQKTPEYNVINSPLGSGISGKFYFYSK